MQEILTVVAHLQKRFPPHVYTGRGGWMQGETDPHHQITIHLAACGRGLYRRIRFRVRVRVFENVGSEEKLFFWTEAAGSFMLSEGRAMATGKKAFHQPRSERLFIQED
jgi:hypothetical protein